MLKKQFCMIPVILFLLAVPAAFAETADYVITVVTAKGEGAGTNANVYVTLFGTQGMTGRRFLDDSKEHKDVLEEGQTDTFGFPKEPDIGDLIGIRISTDLVATNKGIFMDSPHWKLATITVSKNGKDVGTFTHNDWVNTGQLGLFRFTNNLWRIDSANQILKSKNTSTARKSRK